MGRFPSISWSGSILCLLTAWLGCAAMGHAQTPDAKAPSSANVPSVNLHHRRIEDRAPMRNRIENENEYNAYYDALITAHYSTSAAFARGARHDFNYAQVWEEPAKFRGEILHIEGRLRRVRKLDAADDFHSQGLLCLYEGWIYTDGNGPAYPWCVVFSDLSPHIHVAESMDIRVAFDGFFFKRYRYAAQSGKVRDCLLLIGHSPVTKSVPIAASSYHLPAMVILGLAGLIAVIAGMIVGLAWWYRRSDDEVRQRLLANNQTFVHPPEDAPDDEAITKEYDTPPFHEV